MKKQELEHKFNEFIESEALDNNEFQEYETCIIEFDNKFIGGLNNENSKGN